MLILVLKHLFHSLRNNIFYFILLEYVKTENLNTFFYFSTDEVYGPALGNKLYKEDEEDIIQQILALASKSGAEQLCVSYHNTYKIPIIRINVMNAFEGKQRI